MNTRGQVIPRDQIGYKIDHGCGWVSGYANKSKAPPMSSRLKPNCAYSFETYTKRFEKDPEQPAWPPLCLIRNCFQLLCPLKNVRSAEDPGAEGGRGGRKHARLRDGEKRVKALALRKRELESQEGGKRYPFLWLPFERREAGGSDASSPSATQRRFSNLCSRPWVAVIYTKLLVFSAF